jgi:hypothetical protein
MSHEPFHEGNSSRPDRVEQQRQVLRGLQAEQAAALEASGTAEKGRLTLFEKEEYFYSSDSPRQFPRVPLADVIDTARIAVGAQVKRHDGDKIETVFLKFTTTEPLPPKGEPGETNRYIELGKVFNDMALPQGRFDNTDLAVALDALRPVKEARDNRSLYLSADLTAIVDPNDDSFIYAYLPSAIE